MYEIYCKLRDGQNLKDVDVARATGITRSTFSDWKNGRYTPKQDKLQKIADYFGVSIEYLMTGKEKENYYINPETAKLAQEVFEDPELRILFDASRDLSPEDLQAVITMVKALQRKEKGENEF